MPTGSKKVRAAAKAFKAEQAKLYKRKERQVKIEYLKGARKRGRQNVENMAKDYMENCRPRKKKRDK